LIFVDSSVWIDYFNGHQTDTTEYLEFILGKQSVIAGDLVLTEVLQGFRSDKDYLSAKRLMSAVEIVPIGGERMAIQAAEYYRFLRKQGVTVRKTIDVLIATYCLEHDMPLLQSDRDFLPFAEHLGLQLVP